MSESVPDRGIIQGDGDTGRISEISELIRAGEQPAINPVMQDAGAEDEPPTDGEQPQSGDDPTEPPAIDYDLEIPISASDGEGEGGESQTISQLKDHYQANKSFATDRDAWEETRRGQENEQMVARQQLNSLAVMLGDVKPELLQAAREGQALNAEHEARMLLQVKPEWAEPAVKKQAGDAMLAVAKDYGFSEQEFISIDNHKVVKLLHDYTVMLNNAAAGRAKLAAAAELTKAQKPAAPQLKTQTAKPITSTASEPDKLAAIGALIDKAANNGKPSR